MGRGMRWLALLVGPLLAGGAYWLFGRDDGSAAAPQFVVATVDRGAIATTVTATGTINPLNSVQIGTYVSGPIQSILVDYNSAIRRGQLLATIDPRPFQMKLDAATADVANARAQRQREQANAQLRATTARRLRLLRAQGIVAQSELDQAESETRQAQAQIALADAQVQTASARQREAEVNLAYTNIVAPVDGVVVARNVSPGQTVAAQFQTPVLFLVAEDLTKMQAAASVSESDIGNVRAGQEASFTVDAFPGTTFHGTVSQVRNAPVNVQNVVTYDVMVAVDNSDLRLRPGMTATVAIIVASRADAVRVPSAALRFRPPTVTPEKSTPGSHVWQLGDNDTLTRVDVQAGISDDHFTEITTGLAAGSTIITGLDHPAGGPVSAHGPSFSSGSSRHGR